MINRRLIRTKVFQALYSYYQNNTTNIEIAENNLMHSLQKMHELFALNLSLLLAIADVEIERKEIQKQQFLKDKTNNLQHILYDNRFLSNLRDNDNFKTIIKDNISFWSNAYELVKKITKDIEKTELYQNYSTQTETNQKTDADFINQLYKKYIYDNEALITFLEETNIHWGQDQLYIGHLVISFIKLEGAELNKNTKIPSLFKNTLDKEESDEAFVKSLFSYTILKSPEYEPIIYQKIKNWEPDRIALSDTIILKMAVTEILNFEQIPIKSSINEYIELAKIFSTPKSKIFINGVLDKVVSHYKSSGEIHKIGRGLKDY